MTQSYGRQPVGTEHTFYGISLRVKTPRHLVDPQTLILRPLELDFSIEPLRQIRRIIRLHGSVGRAHA